MRDFRSFPFSHDGLPYEVRVSITNNVVAIRAYRDEQPANGFSYEIGLDKEYDIGNLIGISAVESLMRTASDDVKLGNWSKLQRELDGRQ